jgi:hypothetical protein
MTGGISEDAGDRQLGGPGLPAKAGEAAIITTAGPRSSFFIALSHWPPPHG